MIEVRVTDHSGRAGKNGVYNTKHNDRNFNYENSAHIDPERTLQNRYLVINTDGSMQEYSQEDVKAGIISEDLHEKELYTELFDGYAKAKQVSLKASHHKVDDIDRIIEDYRSGLRTCPEEVLLYIGNSKTAEVPEIQKISNEEFFEMTKELMNREMEKYPLLRYIDAQMHVDEQGVRHVHARRIWLTYDHGYARECQSAALRDMNIKSPQKAMTRTEYEKAIEEEGVTKEEIARLPKSERTRFNNPKMTFTADSRRMWIAICNEHGISPELTPREASESGKLLNDYIIEKQQAEIAEKDAKLEELSKKLSEAESHKLAKNKGIKSAVLGGTTKIELKTDDAQKIMNGLLTEKALADREAAACERERTLDENFAELFRREKEIDKEVEKLVERKLPEKIKEIEAFIPQIDILNKREKRITQREKELNRDRDDFENYKKTFIERADRALEIVKTERKKVVEKLLDKFPVPTRKVIESFICLENRVLEKIAKSVSYFESVGADVPVERIIDDKVQETLDETERALEQEQEEL